MMLLHWLLLLQVLRSRADGTCAATGGQCASWRRPYEAPPNNAPRPPPREGDTESFSIAADVLEGVSPSRLHGLLGRDEAGAPMFETRPLPAAGLSHAEKVESYRGCMFNTVMSDSISVDRDQSDMRSAACQRLHSSYPTEMPTATVIFVFHNEHYSVMLRSVHSVLNHSPPHLLSQIILVDDASKVDPERYLEPQWRDMQQPLTEYCKKLPKVTLVRLRERRGLMMARMEGAWRATSDALIFLDSHIEATPGWLEPLLARLAEDPRRLVVPKIDGIDAETLEYSKNPHLGLGPISFLWSLRQKRIDYSYGPDGTIPAQSPVMPGGLFAADREWFLGLGGYDPDMRFFGGEEMEISFRTWMCGGGSIETVPCSHVGHIFRSPQYWQGWSYDLPPTEIHRNKLRTAEVWMDGYKMLAKQTMIPVPKEELGDLTGRIELRNRLQCQDFKWFLKNVAKDVPIPRIVRPRVDGELRNLGLRDHCLDTMLRDKDGQELGVGGCHGQAGAQAFTLGKGGRLLIPLLDYVKCAQPQPNGNTVIMVSCQALNAKGFPEWKWDADSGQLSMNLAGDEMCLAAVQDGYKAMVQKCDGKSLTQKWRWESPKPQK